MTLDVLPQRRTSFTLSEDDRVTRSTKTATQTFQSSAAVNDSGDVTVRIGELRVSYAGKPVQRPYPLTVHTGTEPKQVVADGKVVPKRSGWSHTGGVVTVNTQPVRTDMSATVVLKDTTSLGGGRADARLSCNP